MSNFCFETRVLENSKVKLVPFSLERHAKQYFEITKGDSKLYQYTRTGPHDSLQDMIDHSFADFMASPSQFAYALIDKQKPASAEDEDGELAGLMCYTRANDESLHVEIGHVRVAIAYQRRGLARIAACLMTKFALDSPEQGGLGLSRVEWRCHSLNEASRGVPLKLGYSYMGMIKYERVLPDAVARGKSGNNRPIPPRTNPGDLWRDVMIYDMSYEDWQNGCREDVLEMLK